MTSSVSARVRMYRLGELGDCFLLTFTVARKKYNVLIDCGTFQNAEKSKARLTEVVDSISSELKGKPLDVVVATHQHNDHVSGFVHCESAFRKMAVKQVWLSWLDNGRDALARDLGDKYHNLKANVAAAVALMPDSASADSAPTVKKRAQALLNFFGASKEIGTPAELPVKAMAILKQLGANPVTYLRPGMTLDIPDMPAGSVRVHVLGPPHDQAMLERKDPRPGESYDKDLRRALSLSSRFLDALRRRADPSTADDLNYPFNEAMKRGDNDLNSAPTYAKRWGSPSAALKTIMARYRQDETAWRLVDDDWLEEVEGLALWLDGYTNNSSLVLAVELVKSGKVLLFAADAQTGNWSSWADIAWENHSVTTDDLLARTVLYKVGHHGSHNSTLVGAFEKMTHPHLSALIPVDKSDFHITGANGWKMPAMKLFTRILEKTENRVLQMDGVNPPECDPTTPAMKRSWKKTGMVPTIQELHIDVEIQA